MDSGRTCSVWLNKKLVTTAHCLELVDFIYGTVELIVNTNASLVAAGGMVLANVASRQNL